MNYYCFHSTIKHYKPHTIQTTIKTTINSYNINHQISYEILQ